MEAAKTRSLENIEQKMEDIDRNSLRYQVLQKVKLLKTSWIELGQVLYSVWKDKMYKNWGSATFEAYTSKEIGIKKPTAMKLLRSYYFLEKEEPSYLKEENAEPTKAASIPSYEAVDVLRRAKNKKILDNEDYQSLKNKVFKKGGDVSEVKKDLTALIKERQELEPQEARKKRETVVVKRLLSTLKTLKKDIQLLKVLPAATVKQIDSLINKIESEISLK